VKSREGKKLFWKLNVTRV